MGEQPGLPRRRRATRPHRAGPRQRYGGQARGAAVAGPGARREAAEPLTAADLDPHLARAEQQVAGWRTISLRVPTSDKAPLVFTIDQGSGGQPQKRGTLTLDRATGAVVKWETVLEQQPRPPAADDPALRAHRRGARPSRPDHCRHRLGRRRRAGLHGPGAVAAPVRRLAPPPRCRRRAAASCSLTQPYEPYDPTHPDNPEALRHERTPSPASSARAVARPPGSRWARSSPPPRLASALDAVHNPRLAALRFVVPSETLAGAWRDDTPPARAGAARAPVRHPGRAARCRARAVPRGRRGCACASADPVIGTLQSPGVVGLFTAEQALDAAADGHRASASASPTPTP